MSKFSNVSVTKNANIYFDGKVTSRTLHFEDGTRKTLGIMQIGDYEFATDEKELMEILSGDLQYKLPDGDWIKVTGGESFEVPANSKFSLKVTSIVDYCCSYLGK